MIAQIVDRFFSADDSFQVRLVQKCWNGNPIGYLKSVELPVQYRYFGNVKRFRIQQCQTEPKGYWKPTLSVETHHVLERLLIQ